MREGRREGGGEEGVKNEVQRIKLFESTLLRCLIHNLVLSSSERGKERVEKYMCTRHKIV